MMENEIRKLKKDINSLWAGLYVVLFGLIAICLMLANEIDKLNTL